MRPYELMVVFRGDSDVSDEKKAETLIKKIVGAGVKVDSVTYMGKKTMAYEMKHKSEGIYAVATLSADAVVVSDIETQIKLGSGSDVIRYLLTVKG